MQMANHFEEMLRHFGKFARKMAKGHADALDFLASLTTKLGHSISYTRLT